MAAPRYQPPQQSGFGQFIDAVVILVLVFAALFAPVVLNLAGGGKIEIKFKDAAGVERLWSELAPSEKSWATLGQNAVQQAQWEKLGATPDIAAPMIASRYDYTINWTSLIVTALVVIGYFVFLVRVSQAQYRDVIAEKFGSR